MAQLAKFVLITPGRWARKRVCQFGHPLKMVKISIKIGQNSSFFTIVHEKLCTFCDELNLKSFLQLFMNTEYWNFTCLLRMFPHIARNITTSKIRWTGLGVPQIRKKDNNNSKEYPLLLLVLFLGLESNLVQLPGVLGTTDWCFLIVFVCFEVFLVSIYVSILFWDDSCPNWVIIFWVETSNVGLHQVVAYWGDPKTGLPLT